MNATAAGPAPAVNPLSPSSSFGVGSMFKPEKDSSCLLTSEATTKEAAKKSNKKVNAQFSYIFLLP